MDFIIENRWWLLLFFEVLAWIATIFMLFARYKLQSQSLFKWGVVLTVLTGVVPHVTLGIVNYIESRRVDVYTVVIVGLIIYGLTLGKKDIQRLDAWAKQYFAKQQPEPQAEDHGEKGEGR